MRKYRILITGAKGFIGRELVRQLLEGGFNDITALDVNPSALLPGEVRSITGDINDPPEIAFNEIDTVIHLASAMGVEFTERHPIQTMETIMGGTKRLLELSIQNKVSRFILASSSEVYGDTLTVPFSENNPVSPKSIYGAAKLAAEYLCKAFHAEYGLDYTVLRIFNAYGKHQSDRFVIPRFINSVLSSGSIEVYGKGQQTRSFCHVIDVVKYIQKVLDTDATRNKTYNVGDPRNRIAMYDLALKIAGLAGTSDPAIKFIPASAHPTRGSHREIQHRVPDISAIKAVTGYQPMEDFNQRLLEMIEQERNVLAIEGKSNNF